MPSALSRTNRIEICEALVHTDGLPKHSVLLMWKVLKMKKRCHFFFCQKSCITHFTDSLSTTECHLGLFLGLFSIHFCDAVTCLVITVLDLPPLPPKSMSEQVVFTHSNIILLLQNLLNIMRGGEKWVILITSFLCTIKVAAWHASRSTYRSRSNLFGREQFSGVVCYVSAMA